MQSNHWWFLNLNWSPLLFVSLMIIAILALCFARPRSYVYTRRDRQRTVYYPNTFSSLFFTAVLYLGVRWENWWWYDDLIVVCWWLGLLASLVVVVSHGRFLGNPARAFSHAAFVLVMVTLVVSFIGWLLHANIHFDISWARTFWFLLAVAVVLGLLLVFWKPFKVLMLAFVLVGILLVVSGLGWLVNNALFGGPTSASLMATPTVTQTVTTTATPSGSTVTVTPSPTATAACPNTWEIKYLNHGKNRVALEGDAAIGKAKTPAEARAAAYGAVHKIQTDPITLSGYVATFLHKDVAPAKLVNGKCASDEAGSLATQLELALANAKSITAGNAPSNARNSGVDNGRMVSATTSGLTGNLKAVQVELADGTLIWILERCDNLATVGKAPLPTGKTEHQPPASHPYTPPGHHSQCAPNEHVSPYDHHTCIVSKVASQNILRNSTVNSQVKGEGKTPVGTSPGTSTRPTDGGTGCGGPCPGHSATSSSTPSSSPTASITPRTSTPTTPAPVSSSPTQTVTVGPHGP